MEKSNSNQSHNNFTDNYAMIVIYVSWSEIMSCNLSYIIAAFTKLDNAMNLANMNKAQIIISTPAYERRELVEIPEVRRFFQEAFDAIDSMFLWLDPTIPSFWLLAFLLTKDARVFKFGNQVLVDPSCIDDYLKKGSEKLSRFCERKGISPKPSMSLINERAMHNMKSGNWFEG